MAKSDSYQYKIVEICLEPNKLNNFANEASLYQCLLNHNNPFEIIELRQGLLEELYGIINGKLLTEHQKKVLLMSLAGATQNEIAEALCITQSAVHKCISGNIDYKNNKKRYGGIIKKLQKIAKNNLKIQEILVKIDTVKKDLVE